MAAGIVWGLGFSAGNRSSDNANNYRHQTYRYAADKPQEIDPTLPRPSGSKPLEYRTPCKSPKGKDESDLCAQWRAADAAEQSALWAQWGFWVALAGIIGLYWQVVLTRRAVEDTGEATNEMREANRIAAASDRPWLNIIAELTPDQPVNWVMDNGRGACVITVTFSVEHFGNAPAVNVDMIGAIVDGSDQVSDRIESFKRRAAFGDRRFLATTIFPHGDNPEPLPIGINFTPKTDGTGKNVILPYLIACATYTNPITGDSHVSIRVYRVARMSVRISKDTCPFPSSALGIEISRHHPPFYN